MRKVVLTIGLLFLCIGVFTFYNKLYYPPLPIENMSKKEVLHKVKNADDAIVSLINENGQQWYITSEKDMFAVAENIKELMNQDGWIFTQKEGSGLFFEKQDESLIITTEKWTSDYTLIKIPEKE